MAKSPEAFMPLWIADYLADTMHLTARQHGEYMLLLMYSWKQNKSLPADDRSLRQIARATDDEWQEDKGVVMAFFDEADDGFRQDRLERERAKAVVRYNAQAAKSAAGVAARAANRSPQVKPQVRPEVEPQVKPQDNLTHNSHSSYEEIPNTQDKKRAGYSQEFNAFWSAYPRNTNMSKAKAFESWKRSGAAEVPIADMLKAVAGYKAFVVREQARKGGYVVKHAQGWLTERRWEPYLETESIFAAAAPKSDWGDEKLGWTTFKNSIPATVWTSFFAECVPSDDGRVLTAPSAFVRDRIEAQYASRLRSIFGPEFQVALKPVKMSA